jgi:hypothetical protein
VLTQRLYNGNTKEASGMAIGLDPKQVVLNDELLMSQVVSNEAIIRLLVQKGIFTEEESLKMVNVVNLEMAKMV